MNKVTFAGFKRTIASPRFAPIVRLVTRESTRFYNKGSEPKAQFSLLKFPEEDSIFSKTHIVKSILSFSQCQNENECFSQRRSCRTTKWSRAGPSRCGAQCKTYVWGPSEQWFYDVIGFSQTCYDRGRAQMWTTALTRELSTFANVREEICWFWRERSLLTMKFIWRFCWILKSKVCLEK